MLSISQLYGCYRITGPATLVKSQERGATMEAFLGRGAVLELFHPDGDIVMTHKV